MAIKLKPSILILFLMTFFEWPIKSMRNMKDSYDIDLNKKVFDGDEEEGHNTMGAIQLYHSHNSHQLSKTRKIEEQKEKRRQLVRNYRATQTKKGLEEAKKTLNPEDFARLKDSAERRALLQRGYYKACRERRKQRFTMGTETSQDVIQAEKARKRNKERKRAISITKLSIAPPKRPKREIEIENANKAALGQLSGPSWLSNKPSVVNIAGQVMGNSSSGDRKHSKASS